MTTPWPREHLHPHDGHERARLDADRTAKPKTRLLGHVEVPDDGRRHCIPHPPGDTIEYVETGKRIDLKPGAGLSDANRKKRFRADGSPRPWYVRAQEKRAAKLAAHPVTAALEAAPKIEPTVDEMSVLTALDPRGPWRKPPTFGAMVTRGCSECGACAVNGVVRHNEPCRRTISRPSFPRDLIENALKANADEKAVDRLVDKATTGLSRRKIRLNGHTCTLTATTVEGSVPPPCPACQETSEGGAHPPNAGDKTVEDTQAPATPTGIPRGPLRTRASTPDGDSEESGTISLPKYADDMAWRTVPCPRCKGSGAYPNYPRCPMCNGDGETRCVDGSEVTRAIALRVARECGEPIISMSRKHANDMNRKLDSLGVENINLKSALRAAIAKLEAFEIAHGAPIVEIGEWHKLMEEGT